MTLRSFLLVGFLICIIAQESNGAIDNSTDLNPRSLLLKNCSLPAIDQFPPPMMDQYTRSHGGLLVHLIVVIYMFYGLAIVCDDYFVPSLECICDKLHLKPDVAGATFMAAGSSAPELATAVIGVFIAKDDIGLGTVVGSAVFNIAFIVGLCGILAHGFIPLSPWPLIRDCLFYLISILALLSIIYNGTITWVGSLMLLLLYLVYILFMNFNQQAQTWFDKTFTFSSQTKYENTDFSPQMEQFEFAPLQEEKTTESSNKCLQVLRLPLHYVFVLTIPDCRKHCKFYIVTFVMSCIWISMFSYVLVWMITIIGYTLSIPDTVMGLTLLAAGVSVPDALASYLVVKKGQGDMAISNAIGSNVFDILLCLGLPWFIQTAILEPGSVVTMESKGLTYCTVSLLSTIVFILVATHLNGWQLTKKYGIVMIIWYFLFLTLASLYELNVFGPFNLETCGSNYQ